MTDTEGRANVRSVVWAWDEVWHTLQHEAVCYDLQGDYRPKDHRLDINYGENIARLIGKLQKTRLTIEQIELISQLCYQVAHAART